MYHGRHVGRLRAGSGQMVTRRMQGVLETGGTIQLCCPRTNQCGDFGVLTRGDLTCDSTVCDAG